MKHRLIEKKFETPLGIVNCGLTSNKTVIEFLGNRTFENGRSGIYKTRSFQIELIEFKIRVPLHNGGTLTDSSGWIWRLHKQQEKSETIRLNCSLIDFDSSIEFDTAIGEHLDAIEVSNEDWILHVGTEDGEVMNSRAHQNDWFPERLQSKVGFYHSITEMGKNGFSTKIPDLQLNEKLHVQFICAFDKRIERRKKGGTWFAVDAFKQELEDWIGM